MLKFQGFCLVELFAVLSIVAIAIVMVIPSQKNFFQFSTAEVAGAQLLQAIQFARSEAMLKGKPVVLCKSVDQRTCHGEWRDGYLVKSGNTILYAFHLSAAKGRIFWRSFPSNRQSLEFLSTGFSKVENGTFWYCMQNKNDPAWAIVLNQSGRARMVYPDRYGKIYDDEQMLIRC